MFGLLWANVNGDMILIIVVHLGEGEHAAVGHVHIARIAHHDQWHQLSGDALPLFYLNPRPGSALYA